jgi:hypothetical protein
MAAVLNSELDEKAPLVYERPAHSGVKYNPGGYETGFLVLSISKRALQGNAMGAAPRGTEEGKKKRPRRWVGAFFGNFRPRKAPFHVSFFSRRTASNDPTDLVVVFVRRWTRDPRSFIPNGFL